jgi:hypothetical protein
MGKGIAAGLFRYSAKLNDDNGSETCLLSKNAHPSFKKDQLEGIFLWFKF